MCNMGVSENSVPLNPMVLLIIIPIKMAISLGILTQHFQTNPYKSPFLMGKSTISMAIFHCYIVNIPSPCENPHYNALVGHEHPFSPLLWNFSSCQEKLNVLKAEIEIMKATGLENFYWATWGLVALGADST